MPPDEYQLLHLVCTQRRLDEYGVIRCINFIRSEVAAGRDPRLQLASPAEPPPWAADQYLQPVLPDDALLMHDFGDEHPAKSTCAFEAHAGCHAPCRCIAFMR